MSSGTKGDSHLLDINYFRMVLKILNYTLSVAGNSFSLNLNSYLALIIVDCLFWYHILSFQEMLQLFHIQSIV